MQICIPGPTESTNDLRHHRPKQFTTDFKCIESQKVLNKFNSLKQEVPERLKEAQDEELRLVQTNSSDSQEDRRKRSITSRKRQLKLS